MGEHPVVTERHAETGDDVQADEQAEFERPDGSIPQQNDRHEQPDERQRNTNQICGLMSARHRVVMGEY